MVFNERNSDRVAVVLVGGLGTRLRSIVSDRPKPMAMVGTKPFLEYLISRLIIHGFSKVVLCVSYMKEKIIDYFKERYESVVVFVDEQQPLGTAGALRNAQKLLPQRFVVLNGDTFATVNYRELVEFHAKKKADVTIALVKGNGSQFGHVQLDGFRVINFAEKGEASTGNLVNAGVYVMEKKVLDYMPLDRAYSLEKEFFPQLIKQSVLVAGCITEAEFIDIGDPESYMHLLENSGLLSN